MNHDLEDFKRQIRADLQLIWAGQSDSNKRINEIADKIDQQGREIAKSMKETAKLGREVVAQGDQMVGRLKQFDKRFGKFIDAVIDEVNKQAPLERVERLEERVRKLEESRGPAA